jgi:MoaA/NifB/PqqE/SkfB family radical SAM enzyme
MNEYSALKAAWHTERIKSLRETGRCVPATVHIVISDTCNQNCSYCAYRADDGISVENFGGANPNRMIPKEKVFEILDDLVDMGVDSVQFTGGGEPTTHPDRLEIFTRALDKGLRVGLFTNGVKRVPPHCLTHMDWIRYSIDAGSPETYAKIRKSDKFDKVWEHIDEVVKHPRHTTIGINFVVMPENYEEIFLATSIAKASGASYIRLTAMFSKAGVEPYRDINLAILNEIQRAKNLESHSFTVHDVYGQRLSEIARGAPHHPFCGRQHLATYIGGNLKVYRCCTTAYTTRGEAGDLSEQSFRHWWETTAAFDNFDARECSECQFEHKNDIIRYLVDKHPTHVEFV